MTRHQISIALIVSCAMFINALSQTTLGTALPSIAQDFGIAPLRLSIAVTAEYLTLAVFMPMSGWLADRFGARPVFFAALVVYMLATVGCALSVNLEMLVSFRALQGVGGAMLIPVSRLVLLKVTSREQLVQAMTWVTIPALTGTVMGPPVAGLLVTYASWPAIFWAYIPVCLALLALAAWKLPDFREESAPPFDWTGFAYSGLGIAALLLGLDRLAHAAREVWPPLVYLGAAAVLLTLYTRHARRAEAPIIDLRLLEVPAYRIALIGGLIFRSAQATMPFLLPILFQSVFGWSALTSGGLTFASAIGALSVKFAAPMVLRIAGFRGVLLVNGVLAAASIIGCAFFDPQTPHIVIMTVLFLGGWFRSLQYTALNVLTFADLGQRDISRATGVSSMLQRLGQAFGVGLAALVTLILSGGSGQTPDAAHFLWAFVFFGLWTLLAQIIFVQLDPMDGASARPRRALRS
ncbi:MFS transporter [Pseudooceanicola nanhaiensis]|uniref:MFS transporter n=1 Tax=Pseudooceanicola nanhaiensis TaxID=375761 RepID=UPI001CD31D00|nr:MFS transporter [Pseudooceanicola nanhaiensis]MCA0920823.1 MFS transporter [Pseudooceanicola nanhaiensis]